jgi:hypothetical protein
LNNKIKKKTTKIQQNNAKLITITTKSQQQLFLNDNIFNPKFIKNYSKWNKYKIIIKLNHTYLIEIEQQNNANINSITTKIPHIY